MPAPCFFAAPRMAAGLKPDGAAAVYREIDPRNKAGRVGAEIDRCPAHILGIPVGVHGGMGKNLLLPRQIGIHRLLEHGRVDKAR